MSPSILPSSVLDKASAIAQHFTSSIKRGNQVQDETRSIGCPSPRLPSRTASCLSLATESADQLPRLNSISSDTAETVSGTDLTLMSPREDKVFDLDRSIRRRRDSTLSKHDQLLIGKIKNYYESAGSQDSTFSLHRRESLTYIPSGLVRSSVSRFNSVPNEEGVPTSTSSNSLDGLSADSTTTFPEQPRTQEEFRPSSQIIQVWEEMEQQICKSQTEAGACDQPKEALKASRENSIRRCNLTKTRNSSDLPHSEVDSASPSFSKTLGVNRSSSLKKTLKVFGEEAVHLRATVPRVGKLRVLCPDVGSTGSSRGISQSRVSSRSPLSPSPSAEGFSWPDVCELRSKYSNHGDSLKGSVSRSGSVGEQMFDRSMRRYSNSLLSDVIGRLQEKAANGDHSGYYIAAEAPRTGDPNHKIIVVEKLPEPEETNQPKEEDDGGYVQIPKTEPARSQEPDKMPAASTKQAESQKTRQSSGQSGQQSMVKNLREKFQNRS
uniref:Uncharacterized protein n=1 Tax=Oryzias latipes TaxID=8090 RepID=A0A3P9KBQ8_ORYLA